MLKGVGSKNSPARFSQRDSRSRAASHKYGVIVAAYFECDNCCISFTKHRATDRMSQGKIVRGDLASGIGRLAGDSEESRDRDRARTQIDVCLLVYFPHALYASVSECKVHGILNSFHRALYIMEVSRRMVNHETPCGRSYIVRA